ncbi:C2H2 type zinc finger domain protein [Apiospora aurea]|uniref:C2H2 type zinc finger domain protein n=1 Tax=Apiospora aurea TaxID=335848 RepID=A0ABR1PTE0_9PEZI
MSYDVIPPTSDLNGYDPADVALEGAYPTTRDVNLDFANVFGCPTHPVDQCPFSDFITQSPPVSTHSHVSMNQGYEKIISSLEMENHSMDFYSIDEQLTIPATVLRTNAKEIADIQQIQGRETPIQQVPIQNEDINSEQTRVSKVPKAVHACDFPGCEKQTAFKRREHLRRHQSSKHGLGEKLGCEFCDKKFNRRDNWRQHLRLHMESNGKRTKFFA